MLTTRAIELTETAVYMICSALNTEAARLDALATDPQFPPVSVFVYRQQAADNRHLSQQLMLHFRSDKVA